MSQRIFNTINAETTTGLMLAALLDDFKDAVVSGLSGNQRPINIQAQGMWVDTSFQNPPTSYWSLKMFDGTEDIEVFRVSVTAGTSGLSTAVDKFEIRRIDETTFGATLNYIKNRLINSGQVLGGDSLLELRMIGRTGTSTNPLVGYIKVAAAENFTPGNRGVVLSLASTGIGSAIVKDHVRFLQGIVEAVAPLKINAIIYGEDSIVSTADMILSDDKILTVVTGNTVASIHGIEALGTKVKSVVNNSTETIVIKNNSAQSQPEEQFDLGGLDLNVGIGESATFFYDSTNLKWKYLEGYTKSVSQTIDTIENSSTWISPITGRVRVTGFRHDPYYRNNTMGSFLQDGKLFVCGINSRGNLGLGDIVDRSTPVLMMGAKKVLPRGHQDDLGYYIIDENDNLYTTGDGTFNGVGDGLNTSTPTLIMSGVADVSGTQFLTKVLKTDGQMFAWGNNSTGALGTNDTANRSTPTQVLGDLRFAVMNEINTENSGSTFGITLDGDVYGWGRNAPLGLLGLGDLVDRSVPTLISGLKGCKISLGSYATFLITQDKELYAWGGNTYGQLGQGDVTHRSTPTLVSGLSGVKDVVAEINTVFALTEDGELYGWGRNHYGQLGQGDTVDASTPTLVAVGVKAITQIQATIFYIKENGEAYSCGANTSGSLGVGDLSPRSTPTLMGFPLGTKVEFISILRSAAKAITEDGRYYVWGRNLSYELGLGVNTPVESPVLHPAFNNIPQVNQPVGFVYVDVVQGQSYNIVLGKTVATFGDYKIGQDIQKINIAFERS